MNKLKDKSKVCAVVPFYNEEKTINEIVVRTLVFTDKVILVNDGSTDSSGKVLQENSNTIVIDINTNKGKGNALNSGFDKAVELGYETVGTLDADLQHDPSFIPYLIDKCSDFDLVIGNRLNDVSSMPLQRRISNKLTSFLLSIKTGQKILDSQCGFRAINRNVLLKIRTKSDGFEAESELLILASRNGFKIGFADISTIYGNEKSKIDPVKTILAFIRILFI